MYKKEFKLVEWLSVIEKRVLVPDNILKYIDQVKPDIDKFVEEVVFHKTAPQVYDNILQVEKGITNEFFKLAKAQLLKHYPLITNREKYYDSLCISINDILKLEKNVLFIKGASVQELYRLNTETYRASNDIDVIFPRDPINRYFDFIYALKMIGYSFKISWMHLKPVYFTKNSTSIVGNDHVKMAHIHLMSPEHNCQKIGLDIKCSNYVFLPVQDLMERKTVSRINDVEFYSVSSEDNVYIMIKHIIGHGYLKLNWINDLYLLVMCAKINWPYTINILSKNGMLPIFFSLVNYTGKMYKVDLINKILTENKLEFINSGIRSRYFHFLLDKKIKGTYLIEYLLESEAVHHRCCNRATTIIVQVVLFAQLIKQYLIKLFTKIIAMVTTKVLVPYKIRNHLQITLPSFYQVYFNDENTKYEEKESIQIRWSALKGFEIIHHLLLFKQYNSFTKACSKHKQ